MHGATELKVGACLMYLLRYELIPGTSHEHKLRPGTSRSNELRTGTSCLMYLYAMFILFNVHNSFILAESIQVHRECYSTVATREKRENDVHASLKQTVSTWNEGVVYITKLGMKVDVYLKRRNNLQVALCTIFHWNNTKGCANIVKRLHSGWLSLSRVRRSLSTMENFGALQMVSVCQLRGIETSRFIPIFKFKVSPYINTKCVKSINKIPFLNEY